MAETIEDINIEYEEDGILLIKELKRNVLSKGAWTTIMFLFQEYDRASSDYRPPKISIRRYKKMGGNYRQQSKFNISNEKQGIQIANKIVEWYGATDKGAVSEDYENEADE